MPRLTNKIVAVNAPTREACRDDEHAQIVSAIVERDSSIASQLMIDHLEHIEASLMLNQVVGATDLDKVFASINPRGNLRGADAVNGKPDRSVKSD